MTKYNDQNSGDPTPQFEQMITTAIDSHLLHTWTAIPGIVKSFDAAKQTAEIRVAVLQEVEQEDGSIIRREHPVLVNVPVHFTRGGGFAVTHDLLPGDEGLVVFSARCIDAWAKSGGVQPMAVRRKHSFSDSVFIPGITSVAGALESFQTDALELRNEDRSTRITIKDNIIEIVNPTKVQYDVPEVEFLGHVTINQGITWGGVAVGLGGVAPKIDKGVEVTNGDITNDGVSVGKTHRHNLSGGGTTLDPVT